MTGARAASARGLDLDRCLGGRHHARESLAPDLGGGVRPLGDHDQQGYLDESERSKIFLSRSICVFHNLRLCLITRFCHAKSIFGSKNEEPAESRRAEFLHPIFKIDLFG
jgi:hypothetical protein